MDLLILFICGLKNPQQFEFRVPADARGTLWGPHSVFQQKSPSESWCPSLCILFGIIRDLKKDPAINCTCSLLPINYEKWKTEKEGLGSLGGLFWVWEAVPLQEVNILINRVLLPLSSRHFHKVPPTLGSYSSYCGEVQEFLSSVCLWSLCCGILKFVSVKKLESGFRKQRAF